MKAESGTGHPPAQHKTRLARFLLPMVEESSKLLPTDRWIVEQAREIVATHGPLRRNLGRMAAFAALGGLSLAAGAAGVLLLASSLPVAALAAGGIALSVSAAFSARHFRQELGCLRTETLPLLREEVMTRYVQMKAKSVAEEWKKRLSAQKEARLGKADATEARPTAPLPATDAKANENKAGGDKKEKPSLGGKLGKWALKTALEKAQGQNPARPDGDKPGSSRPENKSPPPPRTSDRKNNNM